MRLPRPPLVLFLNGRSTPDDVNWTYKIMFIGGDWGAQNNLFWYSLSATHLITTHIQELINLQRQRAAQQTRVITLRCAWMNVPTAVATPIAAAACDLISRPRHACSSKKFGLNNLHKFTTPNGRFVRKINALMADHNSADNCHWFYCWPLQLLLQWGGG